MELSHLRVFLEVAEYLNFSKAAKKLHLSQPAVSIKIKSLEKFLKVELFERTQNRFSRRVQNRRQNPEWQAL